MFGGGFDDGEEALCSFVIIEEIDTQLGEERYPGVFEIIEIVSMPDYLDWIEIVKGHALQDLAAGGFVKRHDVLPLPSVLWAGV